ncbi:Phosphopantothenoylcysteine decarboxylase [Acorus calamus]|uniref:phosphopantothenoylcysteine decarboxylase n=1 Tax=Acorus calamus TaxID=4465 RepID=A0AAV9F205_ACOCL|nr:Phosphopantothenoylcysteine decarboxylase [Acorus calamus]
MMAQEKSTDGTSIHEENVQPRKPRVLLAASGSVAAIKFGNLCHGFLEWADVKAVATKSSLHFIDKVSLPRDVILYTDEDEWSTWKKIGDGVLHIELRKWADMMVIAPLSANTLGKIAGGLCDNLLTCIIRAWDFEKPLFVAPAMNTFMWNNPFTEHHLAMINKLRHPTHPPHHQETCLWGLREWRDGRAFSHLFHCGALFGFLKASTRSRQTTNPRLMGSV